MTKTDPKPKLTEGQVEILEEALTFIDSILMEVTSKSVGPLPNTYGELHALVWRIFALGRQYGKEESK